MSKIVAALVFLVLVCTVGAAMATSSAVMTGGGVMLISNDAPVATTFCTSPSIPANNGPGAFTINVGTGCATSTGTVTLPAATTGWVCTFRDVTTPAANSPSQIGGTTTTATLTNYSRTTGLAANWTDNDILRASCFAY